MSLSKNALSGEQQHRYGFSHRPSPNKVRVLREARIPNAGFTVAYWTRRFKGSTDACRLFPPRLPDVTKYNPEQNGSGAVHWSVASV
jgi:hypothetical protein